MDVSVEKHINKIMSRLRNPSRPEPVQPTELPKERWSSLAIDVCGLFPTCEYVVTLIDYYSRWPEAKIMKSITSTNILARLDQVFATHGYQDRSNPTTRRILNLPNFIQHSNLGVSL